VSKKDRDLSNLGDGIHVIAYRDIAIVAKDSPSMDYTFIPKEALIRMLSSHQAVTEEIGRGCTAIPLKFGTMARDGRDVREMLEMGYMGFKRAIEEMEGKVEVDVMGLWRDMAPVLKEIGEREEIRRFKERVQAMPSDEFRNMAVELGRMVKTALDRENAGIRDGMIEGLRGYTHDVKVRAPLDDRMAMNVAFLIEREGVRKLNERVEEADRIYGGKIEFRLVGPLPPYSFSTLEVKRIKAREIEEAVRILGLGKEAGRDEVKGAYRRLLHLFHPDKNMNDPDAQARFERFRLAYETLMCCSFPSYGNDAVMVRVV
jgi:hypothetical protein